MTIDQFLADVKNHAVIVGRDEGCWRHICCCRPGEVNLSFEIITYPGGLLFRGDAGTYAFERTDDMFKFFRSGPDGLRINPRYWSEKCVAACTSGGITEYDPERFESVIQEQGDEWLGALSAHDQHEYLKYELDQLLSVSGDGEDFARRAVDDFRVEIGERIYEFTDFFECNLSKFTHRFLWCCWAITWAIDCYDAICRCAEGDRHEQQRTTDK